MFGRGISCIDQAVVAFAVDGTEPETESCTVPVIAPYAPLIPTALPEYAAWEIFSYVDNELYYFPELVGWDREEEITVGCNMGGEAIFIATEHGAQSELDECGLADGLVLSGTGEWDQAQGISYLTVSIAEEPCTYEYTLWWEDGSESLDSACD